MFNNKELAKTMDDKGYQFSSANSINIGRLVPQVVYYVYSYTRLLAQGAVKKEEKVNFCCANWQFWKYPGSILCKKYGCASE